jgi:inner membrane transporter RhtA
MPTTQSPSRPGDARSAARPSIPPTALVFLAIVSVQSGSVVATHLFGQVQPTGAAMLRIAIAALVGLVIWRPRPHRHAPGDLLLAILFGLTLAALTGTFYLALDRLPLGIAVTVEFLGPLGVAVAGSRRALDILWVVLAAGGIVLLTPWTGTHLDTAGAIFGLLAGVFWAAYIVLSSRVGRVYPGGQGLAMAMVVGGLALLPFGIAGGGWHLLDPRLLLGGLVVACLSSVIPYSLELEALRSLPTRVFGVLMSLEPAAAALIGFIGLQQTLGLWAITAVILVSLASLGATRTSGPP